MILSIKFGHNLHLYFLFPRRKQILDYLEEYSFRK